MNDVTSSARHIRKNKAGEQLAHWEWKISTEHLNFVADRRRTEIDSPNKKIVYKLTCYR